MDGRMDEKQEQKFHQMTETPVSRLICRLAVPCIISMLVTSFYNMADTFFVGMLKSNSATGAVGVVFSLMAIIQAVGFFFGHGSGNFISRELGKQNYEEASNMAATGFFSALAAGALICALGQLFLEPLAVLLALAEELLEGEGACRVHGGGFAGTIQAFVPLDRVERFTQGMEALTGADSCHVLSIRGTGAAQLVS